MSAGKLQQALKFTHAELNANREGKITRKQVERLSNTQDFLGKYAVFIIIVGVLILLFMRRLDINSDTKMIFIILAVGLLCIIPPIAFGSSITIQKDIDQARVEAIQGTVSKGYETSRVGTTYRVSIDEARFIVSRQAYDSFEDGGAYKIYYVPNTKTILSAEIVAHDD